MRRGSLNYCSEDALTVDDDVRWTYDGLGRRGEGLGMRSWLRVAAAITVTAAMASACQGGAVQPPKPPKLIVARLGQSASGDVIAAGTINGKLWRIKLTLASQRSCDPKPGWAFDCLETVGDAVKHWRSERPTEPANIWTFSPALFGPVRPGVTRVSMRLSDGAVVELHPVAAFGHRWIGIALPAALTPVEAIAYAGSKELGHSVPYVGPGPGITPEIEFLSWLSPGVAGPVRRTQVVRGGGENLVLHSGPWGNFLVGQSEGWSFPLGYRVSGVLGAGGGLPQTVPVAFPPPASYLKLVFANGMTRRVHLVLGAGLGFALVRIPARPAVLGWDVYSAIGQRLAGGQGPPGGPYI
jgi:hypothetical protein